MDTDAVYVPVGDRTDAELAITIFARGTRPPLAVESTSAMVLGCAEVGPHAQPVQGVVACTPEDFSVWPVRVYEVDVEAGDCLFVRADDVGAPAGSDLFALLVDPEGASVFVNGGGPCTVGGELLCPSGSITIATSGVALVMVGAYESEGCPAGGHTPFELTVSVGGEDVDLAGAELCDGDLHEMD